MSMPLKLYVSIIDYLAYVSSSTKIITSSKGNVILKLLSISKRHWKQLIAIRNFDN